MVLQRKLQVIRARSGRRVAGQRMLGRRLGSSKPSLPSTLSGQSDFIAKIQTRKAQLLARGANMKLKLQELRPGVVFPSMRGSSLRSPAGLAIDAERVVPGKAYRRGMSIEI